MFENSKRKGKSSRSLVYEAGITVGIKKNDLKILYSGWDSKHSRNIENHIMYQCLSKKALQKKEEIMVILINLETIHVFPF